MSRRTRRRKAERPRKGIAKPSTTRSIRKKRSKGLSPETVEQIEKLIVVMLGAIEPAEKLIELLLHVH